MATNKIITVTVIPTLSGDTIASYNAYSDIDGLLGAMTPAEGLAGKIFTLSDGAIHEITVKAVWATAGETTTVGSNVVTVVLFNYKILLDANEEQMVTFGDLTDNSSISTLKLEFKSSLLPSTPGCILIGYGRTSPLNQFIVQWIDSTNFIIGTSGATGIPNRYLIADLLNKDIIIDYDSAVNTVSITANGTFVTPTQVGANDTTILGRYISVNRRTSPNTSSVELEYLKITVDGVLLHDYAMNEGSGIILTDDSGNNNDASIDIGTGNISTVWLAI